jgi:molybdopterin-binding protein
MHPFSSMFARRLFPVLLVLLFGSMAQAQNNPNPYLYPLTTSAIAPGGLAFSLNVSGTGFVSGAVINWNGSARTTTFVSGSLLTAAITAADIANPQTAVVTVTNPAPGGGTSNTQYFQVTNPTAGVVFQDNQLEGTVVQVVEGDFNHDGKPDLVTMVSVPDRINSHNVLQLQLGNGDGTFQAPVMRSWDQIASHYPQ